jgi:sterol desaturase/sphingolipid hydroxylase (fatty acid hydroxylase superfamily)
VDKQTFLIVLLSSQFVLIILDIYERFLGQHRRYSGLRSRPGTLLFLVGTTVVYGSLQFGGLALVPNAEELLIYSSAFVNSVISESGDNGALGVVAMMVVGVVGFYFVGLCDYLMHRYVSHSRPMWFSHENHHLSTDVSTYMPGMSVRPFAVVVVFPSTAVTIFSLQLALGLSGFVVSDLVSLLYFVVLVQTGVLGASHSAFLRRRRWVHKLLKPFGITTPQEHWLHHASDLECNYGNSVTLWDRVFGTYLDPETVADGEHRAGLAYDQDFLGAITLGKLKLSGRLRNYFKLDRYCYLDPT